MPLLDIRSTTKKNGQVVAWFKDARGRVRTTTSASIVGRERMMWLANYYIELQQEQLDAGLGSSGQAMPPLSGKTKAVFDRSSGRPRFVERLYGGYRGTKASKGLPPTRNLSYTGEMRGDIRMNYVDDQTAKISITRKSSRDKALANERRAPWWGLSPASSQKFAVYQAAVFGGSMEDYLDGLGLVQAGNYMVQLARALNARRQFLRKVAA